MKYCARCIMPSSSAWPLTFDERGVCSACRAVEEQNKIDWNHRFEELKKILEEYRSTDGMNYDCIIPVSGGKDSHFQVHIIKNVFKMNPLLITFNHQWNTPEGIRNMQNMVKKLGCDHIRLTINPQLIPKLARKGLKKMGDPCWFCHAGIFTFPVQIAVKFNIPLIIWGDTLQEYSGMYSFYDKVEMNRKWRKEHGMRGYEPEDMVDEEEGISLRDMNWAIYPSDDDLEKVGVRGIYLGNFIKWDHKKIAEEMIEKYGFETKEFQRTYNTYWDVECWHDNGMHDWLKFLKFGYGRGTDHSCKDLRFGRMTREQAIEMAKKYDPLRPNDLDMFLKFVNMTEEEFVKSVDNMRDPNVWGKDDSGKWVMKDPVWEHIDDPGVDAARLSIVGDFSYTSTDPKRKIGDKEEYYTM